MRAIVHNIHSQVPATVRRLGRGIGTIVSLDSHLDVSLGEDDDVYPSELLDIARRTSAHTELRRIVGENSTQGRVIVAIPQAMFLRHVQDVESDLPGELRSEGERQAISSVARFLAKERGIEVFQSPPRGLRQLAGKVRGTKSWVLDIDIDYMTEMQSDCYTQILENTKVLQSCKNVLRFVRDTKPEVITISEVRVSAFQSKGSAFSRFADELTKIGYGVEVGSMAGDDAPVEEGISDCYEFYKKVSKSLVKKHRDEMIRGDFAGFRRDERAKAKVFFTEKGYTYRSPFRTRT